MDTPQEAGDKDILLDEEEDLWFVCLLGYVKGLHQRSSKTENRTLLAVTMFPYLLRWFMNAGEDRSINVSVFKSFERLKKIGTVNVEDLERTGSVVYNKFDIICMLGPIRGKETAFKIVDKVFKNRGERSRRKALKSTAMRKGITYIRNRERKESERSAAVAKKVKSMSGSFDGAATSLKRTQRANKEKKQPKKRRTQKGESPMPGLQSKKK